VIRRERPAPHYNPLLHNLSPPSKRSRLRLPALALAAVVGLFLLIALTITISRLADHNSGVVMSGEVYRTAQLNENDLRSAILRFHLKSIVNLRGENPKANWYIREVATCREQGVVHADVRLSARHLPQPAEVAKLIADYRSLPQPMLIHCDAGADRTGLAGAIYLIDCKRVPLLTATRALSWHFGHFAIYPYFEMDEFFELFGAENPRHRSLDQWIALDYPAIYQDEAKETEWDEMLEPFESLAKIPYWLKARERANEAAQP
jgi:hypothetical protein